MIVLIDNYNSFTYNLYQYLGELGAHVEVLRNDVVTVDGLPAMRPEALVISPGPGAPNWRGCPFVLWKRSRGKCPCWALPGAPVHRPVVRGKDSARSGAAARQDVGDLPSRQGSVRRAAQPLPATRYHSLIVEAATCPPELEVTAWAADGLIMGLRHKMLPIEGVQFHPESMMTRSGKALLANFLERVSKPLALDKDKENAATRHFSLC